MKTERLYYSDPYLLEFDANVVEIKPIGNRTGVVLDRTAFYPTSGGQPNDLGTINDVRLLDCFEDETSGVVIHVVSDRIPSGGLGRGRVDSPTRTDHMQQHPGQHLFVPALIELFKLPTGSSPF